MRLLAWLWGLTTLTYLIQPQKALPWLSSLSFLSGNAGALLGFAAAVVVLKWPSRRLVLAVAGAFGLACTLAWHSWIGAIGAWTPWLLLGCSALIGEPARSRRFILEWGLALSVLAELLNRLNGAYLSGWEFGPQGQFSRAFPEVLRPELGAASSLLAIAWLLAGLGSFALWALGRRRTAFLLLALQGLVATALYNVIFYGAFLLVVSVRLACPDYLGEWRGGRRLRLRPLHVYFTLQLLFFSQYLFLREQRLLCAVLVILFLATLAAAASPALPGALPWREASARARGLVAAWAFALLVPLVVPAVPAPFLGTYFSARERRFPPEGERQLGAMGTDCEDAASSLAQRWGYLVFARDGACWARTYR